MERLEQNEIHGWVINREHTELNIVLRIDSVSYQAPYSWHERADVSASVGSEFILPGFTITIPDALSDAYTSALQNDKSIEVIANNKVLVNRNKTAPSSELITKKAKAIKH
ncbi:hypothetical protein [Methylocucumis oryzae]|uniref:Uncharacterized protein n=1 Tax=Methylocucumis oryzae TaxID=1632867 RepID=A0A0F3IIZ3_9GAMM|nr:hypothetical protein [Methylocucumis oryzae]KJV06706.1 hypothetical protein VZ94_09480 [Methylocucumis oryzae]